MIKVFFGAKQFISYYKHILDYRDSTNLSLFSGHEAGLFLLWVLPIPESLGYFGHGHFAICLAVGRRWGLLGASRRRWLGGVFLASESTENLGPIFQGVVSNSVSFRYLLSDRECNACIEIYYSK